MKTNMLKFLPILLYLGAGQTLADTIAVIGHAALPKLDAVTVQKLYTGKIVEINGTPITVVNFTSGSPVRGRFLSSFLEQDDEKYIAYWTVRRFIGKGVPPRELLSSAEVIEFVQVRPGAIGYVDSTELKQGANVLIRK